MLKNRYDEIIVGLGLSSLLRGVISLKRGHSTLLVDDKRFNVDSYPGQYLSELEVLAIIRLGKKYQIPELTEVRKFLNPGDINFVLGEKRLKLGRNPLENIKELLRKFPELLSEAETQALYNENEKDFDDFFLEELGRFEHLSYEGAQRGKAYKYDLQGPEWFKTLLQNFRQEINRPYEDAKNLKFSALLQALSVSSEEKLRSTLSLDEIPFYFIRCLSPLYRLQDFFLGIQLKRRLSLLGGDVKESAVQYWQLHDKKFENLLLASFEGVISGGRVLFFSHLPTDVPFSVKSSYPHYKKSQVYGAKRNSTPFPPAKIHYLISHELIGSERPYRVYGEGSELSFYHWPYPELPGSKYQFYNKEVSQDYEQDARNLPFTKMGEIQESLSVTLDLRGVPFSKNEKQVLKPLELEIISEGEPVEGFEYWGPFKFKSLGLLALIYGIEGK